MEIQKERENWGDISRGIGIIFVILGHIKYTFTPLKIWIYTFHMPLFFIISGYFIRKKENLCKDITNRMKKILITYLKLSIIFFILGMLITLRCGNFRSYLISIIVQQGYGGKYESPAWFFCSLLISNIILLCIIYFTNDVKKRIIGYSALLTICGYIIMKYYYVPEIVLWNADISLFMMIFLSIGYLIRKDKVLEKIANLSIIKKITITVFFIVIGSIASFLNYKITNNQIDLYTRKINAPITFLIASVFNSLGVIIFSKLLEKRVKFKYIKKIGKNSDVFYLISVTGIQISNLMIANLKSIHISNNIGFTCIQLLVGLAVPTLVVIILNKFEPLLLKKK